VLTVVEHEQEVTLGDGPGHVVRRHVICGRQAQRRRHGLAHPAGVVDGGEVDHDHASRSPVGRLGGDVESQPRLAHPSRPRDGQDRVAAQEAEDLVALVLPPDHGT